MNVLITGGAGYIGSVLAEEAIASGHNTIVYDNLEKGHREMVPSGAMLIEGELLDKKLVKESLQEHSVDAVIHMAAYSLVGESVVQPAKYYLNNVIAGLALLDAVVEAGVSKFVFSSTAAVYGEPEKQPIEENDPVRPTNPYGDTKLAFERALQAYDTAYGIKSVCLRYFNAAGASKDFGELHDPETHLIPLVLQAAAGELEHVDIFGDDYPTRDGTCVRDYIHVIDLARAHLLALESLDDRSDIFNLGCGGNGYTVREVVETAQAVTGIKIPIKQAPRRVGDPATLIASSDRIKAKLGWQPEFQDLRTIVESAWAWKQSRGQIVGAASTNAKK